MSEHIPEATANTTNNITVKYRRVADTNLSQTLFDKVLCPNLRTGIRMGLLNPDAEGWAKTEEIRHFLEYIGLVPKTKVENLLISTGESSVEEKRPGFINLTAFEGTFLDHGSDTGILNNPKGFSQERLELLKSFAGESGHLTKDSLGSALNQFYQCPYKKKSLFGTNVMAFEVAGLLEIYGQTNEEYSEKYFDLDDIDSLWKHNRFPKHWSPPAKTYYNTKRSLSRYFLMMVARVRQGWRKTKEPTNKADQKRQN